jgi:hypothetical protein
MSSGLTGTYSTTLIHDMGFNKQQSALLNMPTGLVGIICNLTVGWGIRKTSNRWIWAVGLTFRKLQADSATTKLHLTFRSWDSRFCTSFFPASAQPRRVSERSVLGGMYLLNNDRRSTVVYGQRIRTHQTSIHGSNDVRVSRHRQHHRPANIPRQRQAQQLSSSKDHSHGFTDDVCCAVCYPLAVLPVGESKERQEA